MHFLAVKKLWKHSGFVICSYFQDSVFTAVKRDAKFWTRYVKGVPLRRPMKGVPFLSKMMYKSPPPHPFLGNPLTELISFRSWYLKISCHQTNCCVACQSRGTLYQVNSLVESMIIKISSLDENSTHFLLYCLQWRWGAQFGSPFQCTVNPLLSPQGGLIFFKHFWGGA